MHRSLSSLQSVDTLIAVWLFVGFGCNEPVLPNADVSLDETSSERCSMIVHAGARAFVSCSGLIEVYDLPGYGVRSPLKLEAGRVADISSFTTFTESVPIEACASTGLQKRYCSETVRQRMLRAVNAQCATRLNKLKQACEGFQYRFLSGQTESTLIKDGDVCIGYVQPCSFVNINSECTSYFEY